MKCSRCHRNKRIEGSYYCRSCLDFFRRRRRKRLDAEGLCRLCGKRPRVQYRKHCAKCLKRARELNAKRAARKAAWEALQREAAELMNKEEK